MIRLASSVRLILIDAPYEISGKEKPADGVGGWQRGSQPVLAIVVT